MKIASGISQSAIQCLLCAAAWSSVATLAQGIADPFPARPLADQCASRSGIGCPHPQLLLPEYSKPARPTSKLGPDRFTVPATFPIEFFDKYYNDPRDPSSQPQPIITDPITHEVFPLELTDPLNVPAVNLRDPITLPPIKLRDPEAKQYADSISYQVLETINSTSHSSCEKCMISLDLASQLARQAPQYIPALAVKLCDLYNFRKGCAQVYGLHSDGPIIAQMLAFANTTGYDGQYICHNFMPLSKCPLPPTSPLDLSKYIKSPKPTQSTSHQRPSARNPDNPKSRLKVLHISDVHLDPRYATTSDANCTWSDMCCRIPSSQTTLGPPPANITLPAPRFGYYRCDSPLSLVMAAVQAIPILTGTDVKDGNGFNFTIYTGDLVAHDKTYEMTREYVEYIESLLYDNWRKTLGSGPLYAAIGNHDSYMNAQDAPHVLMPERLEKQFSWNYNHLSRLWEHEGWISEDVARVSRAHYGGYAVQRYNGLKIVTLNTDLWYRGNMFNYINMTDPDHSGMLEFLVDELEKSESAGQSVWIVGHVLSGWDGTNPLLNPTNLFYQIVERYSPHVIKAILMGHTHEDQFNIFYANNATEISAEHALATSWIGPSITPSTNLNSGFRMYEVDPDTYEILDAHTWYSDVETYSELDQEPIKGLTYQYEYSTREAYGKHIPWPTDAPLNATWWHHVTERMLHDDGELMNVFTRHQGKSSSQSPLCQTKECIESKVCYMRSGSGPIGRQCKQGYGSVQGGRGK